MRGIDLISLSMTRRQNNDHAWFSLRLIESYELFLIEHQECKKSLAHENNLLDIISTAAEKVELTFSTYDR